MTTGFCGVRLLFVCGACPSVTAPPAILQDEARAPHNFRYLQRAVIDFLLNRGGTPGSEASEMLPRCIDGTILNGGPPHG